jgi:hypothetical protein
MHLRLCMDGVLKASEIAVLGSAADRVLKGLRRPEAAGLVL